MTSKIKLKLGSIEVEYEGSEEFLKQELPTLLRGIIDLYRESGDTESKGARAAESKPSTNPSSATSNLDLSVGTIASRLGVSTGPDLVVAACASLTFVRKQESFDRKAILNEMKQATAFYKTGIRDNMGKHLSSLVGNGKIIERSSGVYVLSSDARAELLPKLQG